MILILDSGPVRWFHYNDIDRYLLLTASVGLSINLFSEGYFLVQKVFFLTEVPTLPVSFEIAA